jgi:hypothetical protein
LGHFQPLSIHPAEGLFRADSGHSGCFKSSKSKGSDWPKVAVGHPIEAAIDYRLILS